MSASTCERFINVRDRAALGESLEAEELRLAREHAAGCAACAAEARVYEQLGSCLESDADSLTSTKTPAHSPAPTARRRKRWAFAAAAATALSAAAATALLWSPRATREKTASSAAFDAKVVLALAAGEVELGGARAAAGTAVRAADELKTGRGRACLSYAWGATACADEGSVLYLLPPEQDERGLRLERGSVVCRLDAQPPGAPFSVETPRGRITAKGTVFTIEQLPNAEVAVRLHRGVVEVTPTRGTPRELRAPAALVLGDEMRPVRADDEAWRGDAELIEVAQLWSSGAVLPLDLATDPPGALIRLDGFGLGESPVSALVGRGEHELVVERAGFATHAERISVLGSERVRRAPELRLLAGPSEHAAESAAAPATQTAEAVPSAAELLAKARALRAAGRYADAAASYQTLITARAASAEARAALVSLGELQLSQLKSPGAALRSFESYLSRDGTLTQEARYGRIRALRALGRGAEAERAAREFVERYPGSAQAKLLQQLSKP